MYLCRFNSYSRIFHVSYEVGEVTGLRRFHRNRKLRGDCLLICALDFLIVVVVIPYAVCVGMYLKRSTRENHVIILHGLQLCYYAVLQYCTCIFFIKGGVIFI